MGLEASFETISDLNALFPLAGDYISQGDDHIRGVKNVLKNQLGSLGTDLLTMSGAELNQTVDAFKVNADLRVTRDITFADKTKGIAWYATSPLLFKLATKLVYDSQGVLNDVLFMDMPGFVVNDSFTDFDNGFIAVNVYPSAAENRNPKIGFYYQVDAQNYDFWGGLFMYTGADGAGRTVWLINAYDGSIGGNRADVTVEAQYGNVGVYAKNDMANWVTVRSYGQTWNLTKPAAQAVALAVVDGQTGALVYTTGEVTGATRVATGDYQLSHTPLPDGHVLVAIPSKGGARAITPGQTLDTFSVRTEQNVATDPETITLLLMKKVEQANPASMPQLPNPLPPEWGNLIG